ncbi:hypothetical protein WR25_00414 [Diploscapter pachys]|uniref:Uncharacterized protein n=1 Tax=Diploscapter pachys TaxID=2018661 RepID=A0A2A2JWB7_9BILA|nr:hypothetical protein WR25_00414 [Diploscapter pachys]
MPIAAHEGTAGSVSRCHSPGLAGQPGLNGVATVLRFPFLQQLVVAAFGLNNLAAAIAIFGKQGTQLGLKLNLCLQLGATLQGLEFCELGCELLLKLAEFCQTRHR